MPPWGSLVHLCRYIVLQYSRRAGYLELVGRKVPPLDVNAYRKYARLAINSGMKRGWASNARSVFILTGRIDYYGRWKPLQVCSVRGAMRFCVHPHLHDLDPRHYC